MSLPVQTVALLQAARDLVRALPADAVLLLPETMLDWDEVGHLSRKLALGCGYAVVHGTIRQDEIILQTASWCYR